MPSTATTALTITPSEGAFGSTEVDLVLRVHGHLCPLVFLGVRQARVAAALAAKALPPGRPFAFTRGRACALDGVQLFTGCTFGNMNLVQLRGNDFALYLTREDGEGAVHVVPDPAVMREIRLRGEERAGSVLMERLREGDASALFSAALVPGAPALTHYPGEAP